MICVKLMTKRLSVSITPEFTVWNEHLLLSKWMSRGDVCCARVRELLLLSRQSWGEYVIHKCALNRHFIIFTSLVVTRLSKTNVTLLITHLFGDVPQNFRETFCVVCPCLLCLIPFF